MRITKKIKNVIWKCFKHDLNLYKTFTFDPLTSKPYGSKLDCEKDTKYVTIGQTLQNTKFTIASTAVV